MKFALTRIHDIPNPLASSPFAKGTEERKYKGPVFLEGRALIPVDIDRNAVLQVQLIGIRKGINFMIPMSQFVLLPEVQ